MSWFQKKTYHEIEIQKFKREEPEIVEGALRAIDPSHTQARVRQTIQDLIDAAKHYRKKISNAVDAAYRFAEFCGENPKRGGIIASHDLQDDKETIIVGLHRITKEQDPETAQLAKSMMVHASGIVQVLPEHRDLIDRRNKGEQLSVEEQTIWPKYLLKSMDKNNAKEIDELIFKYEQLPAYLIQKMQEDSAKAEEEYAKAKREGYSDDSDDYCMALLKIPLLLLHRCCFS